MDCRSLVIARWCNWIGVNLATHEAIGDEGTTLPTFEPQNAVIHANIQLRSWMTARMQI